MKPDKTAQQLKDRLAYRETLINRSAEIEKKLKATEAEIKALRGKAS